MNETKRETKERRIHRERMDEYVFVPSRDFGGAMLAFGAGVGLTILAAYTAGITKPLAGALFVVGVALTFCGAGWSLMIRTRLDNYYNDVMLDRAIDEMITTLHEPENLAPRVIRNENGKIMTTVDTSSNLNQEQWGNVAFAIREAGRQISQAALAKNSATKIMSQPQYEWFYNYMITNGYMKTENNRNILTREGMAYLDSYIYPPTPSENINF